MVNEQFEDVSKEAYDVANNVLTVKNSLKRTWKLLQKRLMDKARLTQYGAEQLWNVLENIKHYSRP